MTPLLYFALGFVCGILFVVSWIGLALYSMAKTAAKHKPKAPSTLAVMVPPTKPGLN